MHVRTLTVTDFRCWEHAELALKPGVAVLVGPNGHGKTNLVEALGYVATLGSHRVATDAPLVRLGAERAVVRTTVVHDGRELTVELEISPGRANRARVNRSPVPRPREVLGILRTVLFAPEDLALVRGDPGERRRFLDELLVTRTPRLAGVRADYDKVLRQRSALLKTAGRRSGDLSTLDVWDGHLARHGAELLAARLALLDALGPHVVKAYAGVAGPGGETTPARAVGLRYRASLGSALPPGPPDTAALEAAVLAELARVRPQEVERGVCLVGPHRDDVELLFGDGPAKGYASHGESWSLALALRLGSYELLRGEGAEPVLVLDDVFAELDRRRRSRLAEVALGAEQVLVTAAVAQDVPDELGGTWFDVQDGQVRRASG